MSDKTCPKCSEEGMFNLKWTKGGWLRRCVYCGFETISSNSKINDLKIEEEENENTD